MASNLKEEQTNSSITANDLILQQRRRKEEEEEIKINLSGDFLHYFILIKYMIL